MPNQSIDEVLAEIARAAAVVDQSRSGPQDPVPVVVRSAFAGVAYEPRPMQIPERPGAYFGEYLDLSDAEFVDLAYRRLLDRPADPAGKAELIGHLERGTLSRARALANIAQSSEAQKVNRPIIGLRLPVLRERLGRLPVVGRVLALLGSMINLPGLLAAQSARLARLEQQVAQRMGDADTRLQAALAATQVALDGLDNGLQDAQTAQEGRLRSVHGTIEQHTADLESLRQLLSRQRQDLSQLRAEASMSRARLQDEIRRLGSCGLPQLPARSAPAEQTDRTGLSQAALDEVYLAFEQRFRGDPAAIMARMQRYLPLFTHLRTENALPILDVGCGRGEWLLALQEAGLVGYGVDLNPSMLDAARANGLDVAHGDAIAHLESVAQGSLAAVTGFHIIEHLPFDLLIRLLDGAYRALAPGGHILFETPNPECLVVGGYSFHLDHTHLRPLPPILMSFLAEQRGFGEVRILRNESDIDLAKPVSVFDPQAIENWFQQPLDYALFARKGG